MNDLNNPTGSRGLLAIDKRGSKALFLDPTDYHELARLDLPARPHELAISADHRQAYVSIYGSGVYGNNPEPGQLIVVLDLESRQQLGTIDVSPYRAPHGLMLDSVGLLYASCDHSGVVAVVDATAGHVVDAIDAGSNGPHMIALLPDGSGLYSENEEDPFVSVMQGRQLIGKIPMPGGSAGICATADGQRVLVVAGQVPELAEISVASNTVVRRVALTGHQRPAQRVRNSPDGRWVVVTATEEPLVTILDASLSHQTTFETSAAPMGVAFAPDTRTALVANHGAGRITVVDLASARPTSDFPAGTGVETLAFY